MPSPSQRQVPQAVGASASSNVPVEIADRPSIGELPFTVAIGAFWIVLVDAPRLIQLGPVTLSGAFTLLVAALTLCLLPGYAVNSALRMQSPCAIEPPMSRIPWAMWAFLLLLAVSFTTTTFTSGITSEAIQNTCVYLTFVGAIGFASTSKSTAIVLRGWELMRTLFTCFAYFALAITVLEQVVAPGSVDNSRFIFTPRSMAMVGLIALAVVIPGVPRNTWMKFAPFALVIAMALSLSRTSTVIGLALLVFFVLRDGRATYGKPGGRLFKGISVLVVVAVSVILLILYYAPFRDRFVGGDNAWDVGGVSISTQGRAKVWEFVLSNSYDHWLFGHGVGSASQLVSDNFRLNHPHNEYIRLYYDFGFVGLSLFVVGFAGLGWLTYRNARRTDSPIHWAAFIALIGVSVVAITDNPFVYPFVMLPIGSLVGISIALSRFELPPARPGSSR